MTDQPPLETQTQARTWDMLCHLSALAGYLIPFGNLIGPLLIWQLKKNEFPSVNEHGKESLNFQISVTLYAIVCAVLILLLVGVFLLFVLGIANLVLVIIASIKANNAQPYRYPLTLRFLK